MFLKNLFNRSRDPASLSGGQAPVHAIIDTSNDTLVMIGAYPPHLVFLGESLMDTTYAADIIPNKEAARIKRSGPHSYPEWSLDSKKWTFKRTNPAIITESMRERSILAAKKMEAISYLMYAINRLRVKLNTGFFFQETIYAEKEKQAHAVLQGGASGGDAEAAPYVAQYAEDNGMPLKQAAEEIALQARLDREYLVKTERVRLAVFRKLKLAKTPEEVQKIVDTFRSTGGV